jgi:predicted SprT family Zn-dependent metalloprotease
MTVSDDDLKVKAQATANAFAKAYNSKHGSKIPVPVEMTFDLELTKPRTAGIAVGNQRVMVNMTLYRDHVSEFLNWVIPHEVAHLAQTDLATGDPEHGPKWRALMESMFRKTNKTHNFDTRKAVAVFEAHKVAKKELRKALKKGKTVETADLF